MKHKKMTAGKIKFVIEDNNNIVGAALTCNGKMVLDYENTTAKDVRITAPLPKKEKLLETAILGVQKDNRYRDVSDWLDFYIRCREREIYEQVQEIRKAIKRLVKIQQCIKIVHDMKQEHGNAKGDAVD